MNRVPDAPLVLFVEPNRPARIRLCGLLADGQAVLVTVAPDLTVSTLLEPRGPEPPVDHRVPPR